MLALITISQTTFTPKYLNLKPTFDQHSPTMAPTLSTLPAELLECVARAITDDVHPCRRLLHLRATCRAIEQATRHCFVKHYFATQSTNLLTAKLDRLLAISKVPYLAAGITELEIACEEDGVANPALLSDAFLGDAARMRLTDIAVKAGPLLTLALQHLTNIKSLCGSERGTRAPSKVGVGGTTTSLVASPPSLAP